MGRKSKRKQRDKPARRVWEMIGICAGLAILVWAVFGQTGGYVFVNYDDNVYVYANRDVTAGLTAGGIARAFTQEAGGLWTPLVTISHMLDWQLYGSKAGGHHLTNVALHLGSVILLFQILLRMTGAPWRSGFVAALFAIHPLHVESVAWIAERKDVLSGFFFMLTLGAYARYVQRPGSVGRYLAVLVLFAMGLMSKPMVVTLPFVLLLLDYWPLRRLFRPLPPGGEATGRFPVNWRVVVEKLPLLALSAGLCVAVLMAPRSPWSVDSEVIPFWTRMREAPVWVVIYLGQMIRPARLAVVYTHYEASLPWWPAALGLIGALSLGIYLLRGKHPYLWMGWLWNLGMLIPVLGVVQISRHARADHYNYLPQIGLYIGLTWLAADWAQDQWPRRVALGAVAAVALDMLAVAAYDQTACWRDGIALWTQTLECTRDNFTACNDLALLLAAQGRAGEAMAEYREALRSNPAYTEARNNLGALLDQQGRTGDAIAEFREALRIRPDYAEAHSNLGDVLFQQGKTEEAIAEFREALRIDPEYADAHSNLGYALFREGRTAEAMAEYRAALRIDPGDLDARSNLGEALLGQGRTEEAVSEFRAILASNPAYPGAEADLDKALDQSRGGGGASPGSQDPSLPVHR